MKYRDLIQFDPIESVIVLRSADDHNKALISIDLTVLRKRIPLCCIVADRYSFFIYCHLYLCLFKRIKKHGLVLISMLGPIFTVLQGVRRSGPAPACREFLPRHNSHLVLDASFHGMLLYRWEK